MTGTLPQTETGTVVCLGAGPSLTATDAEILRSAGPTIAVNDAWRLAPWADVLYSSDQYWFPYHQWVPEFRGLRVALELEHPGVLTMRNAGEWGLAQPPGHLAHWKLSGLAAIGLAVQMGARRVLLLGYDMGRPGHFFGAHPRGLSNAPVDPVTPHDPYRYHRGNAAMLAEQARVLGVEIANCSPGTALTCFPRMSAEEALCVPR